MANLLDPAPPRLRWAVVDGAWASTADEFRDYADAVGLRLIVDTQGWRSQAATDALPERWRNLPHRPQAPLWSGSQAEDRAFVEQDVAFQRKAGAGAYLIPGPLPVAPEIPIRGALRAACAVAQDVVFDDPKPTFAFLGVHTQALDEASAVLASLPAWLSGVYVQFTPVNPLRDGVSKLSRMLAFLMAAEQRGLHVVAGHFGAIGALATALGIGAADAGIADSEQFRVQSRLRRGGGGGEKGAPRGTPRYIEVLQRTLNGRTVAAIDSTPTANALVLCGPECCAYYTADQRRSLSREHSLRERLRSSESLQRLPMSMRADEVYDRLERARQQLQAVNTALLDGGHMPLDGKYLETQLAVLDHVGQRREIA